MRAKNLPLVALALAAVDCAEPTYATVDVRAEVILCDLNRPAGTIKRTGIAVTTPDRVESDPVEIFEGPGCEEPGDRIGTLTLTPSGEETEAFGIRVVAGIDRPAEQCAPPYEGCIVERRVERFTPGTPTTITIILRAACIGKGFDCKPEP